MNRVVIAVIGALLLSGCGSGATTSPVPAVSSATSPSASSPSAARTYSSVEALLEAATSAGLPCESWEPPAEEGDAGICDDDSVVAVWPGGVDQETLRSAALSSDQTHEFLIGENWVIAATQMPATVVTLLGGELITASDRANIPEEQDVESPEDTARSEVAATWGTYETVGKSGRGASVIRLPGDADAGIVTATHNGSSNFVIGALDSNNDQTELLVNEIGRYSGTTGFGLSDSDRGEAVKLKIEADGAWTIKIKPVSKAPILAMPASGTGDKVLIFTGDVEDWKLTHKGQSNFVVIEYTLDDYDLLVNEIGKYSGTVPASAGPSVVVVEADGNWTIKKA